MNFLQIEPTNNCNQNCVMCTRRNLQRYGSMSMNGLRKIIGQIPDVKAVKLHGLGEPMLNPEIIPMIQYLRSQKIRVYSTINGTILPEKIEDYINIVNRIDFSIDTLDEGEFMIIRGVDCLNKVMENFRILCAARKKRLKPPVYINSTMLNPDLKNIEKLFRLVKETKCDGINFYPVQNWTTKGNRKTHMVNKDKLQKIIEGIIRLSKKWRVRVSIQRGICGYEKCKWASGGCYITWDGYVTPCSQRPDPDEINFGNIFESGFETIYNSNEYNEFRSSLLRGEPPEECKTCSIYKQAKVRNNALLNPVAIS